MRRLIAMLVVLAGLLPVPAFAHPHIFIDATAKVTFNDAGQVVAIHNSWVFDEAYSAWSIQGLDTNNDGKVSQQELQPLADDNMNGPADYEYYTFAGEGNDPNLKFSHGSNPTIDYDGHRTTLNFDVALAQPYTIRKALQVSIDDPEYYVAITFKDASSIQLINAPKNCSVAMEAGHDIPDAIADELYALPPAVTKLPPALEHALADLRSSWTGFWLLGLLSFLYGIFLAAGPGHGKVVISSYVLANEAQMRRGVLLSFFAAMLQSLVAIGFVLIAATALGMTAMAMSDAANWIGILSYGLVMLLGLWLILRKIFGWGHTHEHAHETADAAPA